MRLRGKQVRRAFLVLLTLVLPSTANAAFSRRKPIVIDSVQVTGGSNLASFPVLVSLVDPDLKANVASPLGDDIVFRAEDDTTCGGVGLAPCLLDHEIETWDAATGALVAWVRVPVLRTFVNTTIYIYYGDSAVTCSQEKARAVWDTGFREVFHLDETGDRTDSTANGFTGVSKGTVGQNVAGKIGLANELFGPSESRLIISDGTFSANMPVTLEIWFKLRSIPAPGWLGLLTKGRDDPGPDPFYDWVGLGLDNSGGLVFEFPWNKGANLAGGPAPLNTDTWYYAAATFDGGTTIRRLFLDGVQVNADSGVGLYDENISQYTRAGDDSNGNYLDGFLDEIRISNVARSPNWIRTTFNNLSDPSSFYALVGPEDVSPPPVTATCAVIEAPCQGVGSGTCHLRSIGTAPDYSVGTLAAANGSILVTGTGTTWLSANRGRGDRITIGGLDYTVLGVDSETQLRLTSPFLGATGSGKPYNLARKFVSPAAWEDCIDGPGGAGCEGVSSPSLVGDNRGEIGIVYDDADDFYGGSPVLVIDGSVTDETHAITLTADGGNRHMGFAWTGVVFNNTSSNPAVQIEDDHVTLEWLEVNGGATAAAPSILLQNVALENHHIVLRNNVIHDTDASAVRIADADAIADLYDNVVYAVVGPLVDITQPLVRGSRVRLFNNTFYSTGVAGINVTSATDNPWLTLSNNVLFDPVGFGVEWVNVASRNNLSGDAAPPTGPFLPDLGHSPAGGGVYGVSVASASFCNVTPGVEDLHVQSGSTVVDAGITLAFFGNDIDDSSRSAPWDIGADELGGPCYMPGTPTLSSSANQSFTVGSPAVAAALMRIVEDPVAPTITATGDVRLRIPSGFPMRFDTSQTTVSVSGPAGFKVSNQIKGYEDLDQTVVLDVLFDFTALDQVDIDGLRFASFTAPASDYLTLEVGNDDLIAAVDDKTVTIVADSNATLSSDDHQVFTQGQPPVFASPFTITEAEFSSTITPANDILIRIPPGYNMTWDPAVTLINATGSAAARVDPNVSYLDSDYTLLIPVLTSFAPGEFLSVNGLKFQGFGAPSPVANLELFVGSSNDFDDKTIEIKNAGDLAVLTATAKDSEVTLEWVAPATGACNAILILRRDDGLQPTGPTDPMATTLATPSCTLGATGLLLDDTPPLTNGNLYAYAAFVEHGGGLYTPGRFVKARPVDTAATPVHWAYSTGATAMAPPGIRFYSGASYVYAVSNDAVLHGMRGGPSGGRWPASWKPSALGGPAQGRPPAVGFSVGTATEGAAFVGSQDGRVYAIDARDGRKEWTRPIASMVQAAPAGHFQAFDATAFDIVIAGTRNANAANALVALDVHTGMPVWSFDNSLGQNGDDKEIGIIGGSATIDYELKRAYFASRARSGGSNHTLWCVDFSSGSPLLRWSLALGDIDGSPVQWIDTIYVGTNSGVLYALDRFAPTGTIKWSHPIGDGAVKSFVFPEFYTRRVLASTNGKITSIEDLGLTYNVSWQVASASIPGPSTPVFVPETGKILVGSSDGHLYQLDAVSPLPAARVRLGDGSAAVGIPSIDVLTDTIYVGTEEGVIYAVAFPIP